MAQLPFIGTPVVGPDDFPFIGMPDLPFENKTNKGAPSGYAPLDANSKVPTANLPDLAALDAEVDGKITTHNSATTSVHGIANTANLVLTNDSRLSDPRAPTAHSHAIADVTSLQTTLDGKALSSHTHAIANVTGLQTALDGKQASGSYVLTSDPRLSDSRTPTAHAHAVADVTGLQTALDGKQASGSYAPATGISPTAITGTAVITTDPRLSDSRTPTAHAHTIADVTSLQTTLDGKASSSHAHTISDVTNLQTTLDGKQASGSYAPASGISPSAITGTAVITTDARLSDNRTPTSHSHSISEVTSLQATLTAFAIALG